MRRINIVNNNNNTKQAKLLCYDHNEMYDL